MIGTPVFRFVGLETFTSAAMSLLLLGSKAKSRRVNHVPPLAHWVYRFYKISLLPKW
jgi:hypothetical protein